MTAERAADTREHPLRPDVAALIPMLRRIVRARVPDAATVEDLVQETLARVLAAESRVDPAMLEPYAIVTARNVVASMWREEDRHRRNRHRVLDVGPSGPPDDGVLLEEERVAIARALRGLSEQDRETLLAHELHGRDTKSLAEEIDSTPGAVAAQLSRTRARLRVEYLLALEHAEPVGDRCRPVLLALSGGDRRRQREVDAARHLLECDLCARLSEPLLERARSRKEETAVPVRADKDVVLARQAARELAVRAGFQGTDLTIIATAVSEITRNIVRFAGTGEVTIELLENPAKGIRVIARDTGPGIVDVDQALTDGYSTYSGLGLGLPGARRLMDEFAIASEVDRGTTVTMTKWLRGARK